MTDRTSSVVVVFETDMRVDDAEFIINAIRAIRGVISVTPTINTYEHYAAKEQARRELRRKIYEVLE